MRQAEPSCVHRAAGTGNRGSRGARAQRARVDRPPLHPAPRHAIPRGRPPPTAPTLHPLRGRRQRRAQSRIDAAAPCGAVPPSGPRCARQALFFCFPRVRDQATPNSTSGPLVARPRRRRQRRRLKLAKKASFMESLGAGHCQHQADSGTWDSEMRREGSVDARG